MSLKKHVPFLLTTLRLALGPVALAGAVWGLPRLWYVPLLAAGLGSDIFDGILARRWRVATPTLRRYDSITDIIYYLFILATAWTLDRDLLIHCWPWIGALIVAEATCITISLLRFGAFPATHSFLAKAYGLGLFGTFVALLGFGGPAWIVPALGLLGLVADLEICAILLLSRRAPVDVPSVFSRWPERA